MPNLTGFNIRFFRVLSTTIIKSMSRDLSRRFIPANRQVHTTRMLNAPNTGSTEPTFTHAMPKLSYALPEPNKYTGYHLIEIQFPPEFFIKLYYSTPIDPSPTNSNRELKSLLGSPIEAINGKMQAGLFASGLAQATDGVTGEISLPAKDPTKGLVGSPGIVISPALATVTAVDILRFAEAGKMLTLYRGQSGSIMHKWLAPFYYNYQLRPRIFLVEKITVASYLGNYAAGRILKTMTLAPGETVTMSIDTYRSSSASSKTASNIFDSLNDSSEEDFQRNLADERSSKNVSSDDFAYHVDAQEQASFSIGIASGSESLSAGVKGDIASAHEELGKIVSGAISKQAHTSSAKRDVQVNSESDASVSSNESTATTRQVKNVNVSRTMNLVFRQMNQEHITLTYLTDVKVGFFNGDIRQKQEVPINKLKDLLSAVIIPAHQAEAKATILKALSCFIDYKGNIHNLVETKTVPDPSDPSSPVTYSRFNTSKLPMAYTNETADFSFPVPGYILREDTNIVRTDAVLLDVFLGEGEGLDTYSTKLQQEANRSSSLQNDKLQVEINKTKLGIQVVNGNNTSQGALFHTVFFRPECCDNKPIIIAKGDSNSVVTGSVTAGGTRVTTPDPVPVASLSPTP